MISRGRRKSNRFIMYVIRRELVSVECYAGLKGLLDNNQQACSQYQTAFVSIFKTSFPTEREFVSESGKNGEKGMYILVLSWRKCVVAQLFTSSFQVAEGMLHLAGNCFVPAGEAGQF